MWGDKDVKIKLLRKGILTRIHAPMVIIQGLRESGVFDSVITSASETQSKEKFLSSITSSNSSKAIASQSLPSRRVGRSEKYQATARKALNIEAGEWHESAVPPQSPPGI